MFSAICVSGQPPQSFEKAISSLYADLGMALNPSGFPLEAARSDHLTVTADPGRVVIGWAEPVQFYRALSYLRQHEPGESFTVSETPCFQTVGIMFDISRNAVLKPEAMRYFLRKMALMGLNLGMLYTEDTYEIPGHPYFGHFRGRYSAQELRDLDNYAAQFGIELCPCIQTLGHLNRVLHWPAYAPLKDTEDTLLIDEDATYEFIEQMIAAATTPYRSKRIHIGMDETTGIGTGRYLQRNGYVPAYELIRRHLRRVASIVRSHGLHAMMWSDMFFRPESPTGGYYDSGLPSEASRQAVCPDIDLVYWDYYHNTPEEFTAMFEKHKVLPARTCFAGGIWTWTGPAPDYEKTLTSSPAGLEAARKAGVPLVLATAWGDNGAEANLTTALPGMQLYAEYNYTGSYDHTELSARFSACCQGDAQAFLELSQFNTIPGMHSGRLRPVNTAKFLLYQDPLVQLYEKDTQGLMTADHFRRLAEDYAAYSRQNPVFHSLFRFYHDLACALALKCHWHKEAGPCVRSGNRGQAKELADSVPDVIHALEILRKSWLELWNSTNRPYGFEIIDLRLGGLCARFRTAMARMLAFAEGGDPIDELLVQPLPYTEQADGTLSGSYAWGEIVSACKTDI